MALAKKKDLATWMASKEARAALQLASEKAEKAYTGLERACEPEDLDVPIGPLNI